MRNLIKVTGAVTLVFGMLGLVAIPVSAETIPPPNQVTVRPADIRPVAEATSGNPGWYRTTTGTASVEPTDAKPYNNRGSLQFNVSGASSSAELALYNRLASHKLADLGPTGLSYATYQTTAAPQAIALQVNVDLDVTDTNTAWQGRMVFEPYMGNMDTENRAITANEWQTWTTLKSDAKWWMTWSGLSGPNPCPQASPCTTAEILADFPDVGFNTGTANGLALKAGSGWAGDFVGYADVPYVGSTTNTYWDFEPAQMTPTNKEQCKNGGWNMLQGPDGAPFTNQGRCVSYVTSNDSANKR